MMTHKPVRLVALVMAAGLGIATAQAPDGPVRVSAGVLLAARTKMVQPEYPQEAKQARIQGKVTMEVTIDKAGIVSRVTVTDGPSELRNSAVTAVSQWEYRPTLLNGQPVEVISEVEINYALR